MKLDTEEIARRVIKGIGYDKPEYLFSYDTFKYDSRLHGQSPDIAMGIELGNELGAGDQGMMFGYATKETEEYLPAPIAYSHRLLYELGKIRKNKEITYLRPDSKSQVSIRYIDGMPHEITTVILSHQTDEVPLERLRNDIIDRIKDILSPTGLLNEKTCYYINPTGKFVIGGPHGDAGLTGRKVIVDTYGGVGSHGGGAFSGKDPSKVDRSAAYYARYAAKNIVAAGLADKCEIQVSYAIGMAEPISIHVCTFGTSRVDEDIIEQILISGDIFDFHPLYIIQALDLLNAHKNGWSYEETANYGHFGRSVFPWEKLDKVEDLKYAIKRTKKELNHVIN